MLALVPGITNGKVDAINAARLIGESRRKLLGLDMPAKTALTNPDGSPYTGDYAALRTVVLQALAPYPDLRLLLADQVVYLHPSNAFLHQTFHFYRGILM